MIVTRSPSFAVNIWKRWSLWHSKKGGPPQTQKNEETWLRVDDDDRSNLIRSFLIFWESRMCNVQWTPVFFGEILFFLSVRIKERQGRNLYRNIKYHFNELFCEWEKRTFEMRKSEKEKNAEGFFFLKEKEKKSTFGMIKGFMRTKRCWWPDELPVFFFPAPLFWVFFFSNHFHAVDKKGNT